MSEKQSLAELGIQYEEEVMLLDAQIAMAREERRKAIKEDKPYDDILKLDRKIKIYKNMRDECKKTARKLINYYNDTGKKHYVKYAVYYTGDGRKLPCGNSEGRGARW